MDILDQVGADLELHSENVLFVLFGEQLLDLDFFGHLKVDLVEVTLGLVTGGGV